MENKLPALTLPNLIRFLSYALVVMLALTGRGGLDYQNQLLERALLLLCWLLLLVHGELVLPPRRVLYPLIFLLGWGLLVTWFTAPCFQLAWNEWWTWLGGAGLALLWHAQGPYPHERRFWIALGVVAVLLTLPELFRNIAAFGRAGWSINVIGPVSNSNLFGLVLAVCVPFTLAAAFRGSYRVVARAAGVLLVAGLVLCYSRMAWMASAAGAVVWLLAAQGKKAIRLIIPLGIVVVGALLLVPATRARLHALVDPYHPSNLERVDMVRAVAAWSLTGPASDVVSPWAPPLLFGGGPGQWGFIYPQFAVLDKWQLHTHTIVLQWVVDGGLPMMAAGLLLVAGALGYAIRSRAPAVWWGLLAVMLIANTFDYFLWIPLGAFLFYLVFLRSAETPVRVARWCKPVLTVVAILLLISVAIQFVALYHFSAGVTAARQGAWDAARSAFARACDRSPNHPLYAHYHAVACARTGQDGELPFGLNQRDPYYYTEAAKCAAGNPAAQLDLDRIAGILDPHQMITGGEEFPEPPLLSCAAPDRIVGWEGHDEAQLLNYGRCWAKEYPVAARQAFRGALRRDVRYVPAYRYYAEFLTEQRDWEGILEEIVPALTVRGKRPADAAAIYAALSTAYAARGDAASAEKFRAAAAYQAQQKITRHSQVMYLLFHVPTLPDESIDG